MHDLREIKVIISHTQKVLKNWRGKLRQIDKLWKYAEHQSLFGEEDILLLIIILQHERENFA